MDMRLVLSILMVTFGSLGSFAQTDIEHSKDYSTLNRLSNYFIVKYSEKEFDSHSFYYEKSKHIHEGKKYIIEYRHEQWEDASFNFPTRLQILRNYSNAIEKAGGRILFERYNSEHGYYSFKTAEGKVIWVQVKVLSGKVYRLIIIEEEQMNQELEIDADLIKNSIELEGKIALYGIHFDLGKSIVKEESEPTLIQIAAYLKANPNINCWVVGHTDSDGSFELNSKLSLDRASAIKKVLQEKHGVRSERLFAEGVGPLAPIATNSTEEGKAMNRRVELVKK